MLDDVQLRQDWILTNSVDSVLNKLIMGHRNCARMS
jgi:hypothetical protein